MKIKSFTQFFNESLVDDKFYDATQEYPSDAIVRLADKSDVIELKKHLNIFVDDKLLTWDNIKGILDDMINQGGYSEPSAIELYNELKNKSQ
jgi:hypothetical protein